MKKPLTISRVLIGEPRSVSVVDVVSVPVIDVRVIAENGAMFHRVFLAFGLDRDRILAAWESEPEKFLKVDPSGAQGQSAAASTAALHPPVPQS